MKNVLPQIKKNYVDSGKIRYSVRDYPLNFHKQAKIAAVAANCAGDQDKYWEMHEILFKNPRALNKPFFKTQAQKLELDMTAYETCLNDEKNIKKINASLASGNKYGVTGTPKFFVGKVKGNSLVDIKVISGAKNYAAFATAINAKL